MRLGFTPKAMSIQHSHDFSVPKSSVWRAWIFIGKLQWRFPLLLLLVTVGIYWKLVLSTQFTWLNSPDLVNQVLPWMQFQASEWHSGHFPMWDPHHWAGQSLIGQGQPGSAYPLNWILFLLPLDQGHVSLINVNLYFVFIHFLAALFCYWLCRDLQIGRIGSLLAGIAFGLGGYVGTTDWPQMINGAIWAPLILLFFFRAVCGQFPALNFFVSGGFLGISFLSGHHQIPIFLTLTALGLWIYYFLSLKTGHMWACVQLGFFAASAFLLSAFQLLPAYEYWRLALRWVGAAHPIGWQDRIPYAVHAQYSFNPVSLLGLVVPGVHVGPNPYIGLTVVILAMIALITMWDRPIVRLFGIVGLCGLLFSFGSYSVFNGILYSLVPSVEKARNPAMALLIVHIALAVLAAFGLDSLEAARLRNGVQLVIQGLACFGAFAFAVLLVISLVQKRVVVEYAWVAFAGLVSLIVAIILTALRRDGISSGAAAGLLVVVLVFDLGTVTGSNYAEREQGWTLVDKLFENADVVEFLKSEREPIRVGTDKKEIPFNFGDWHGIDQFDGYAGVTSNIIRLDGEEHAHMLLGENRWIGRQPNRPGQIQLFEGKSGLRVYKNPDAFPRVWSVHNTTRVRNEAELLAKIHGSLADLRKEVALMDSAPMLESCAESDSFHLVKRESNRVVISANMKCRGMVILGESTFPGWRASVDGRGVPIHAAWSVARGVVVDGGSHTIEMRYTPATVFVGSVLTGGGMLLMLVFMKLARKSSR